MKHDDPENRPNDWEEFYFWLFGNEGWEDVTITVHESQDRRLERDEKTVVSKLLGFPKGHAEYIEHKRKVFKKHFEGLRELVKDDLLIILIPTFWREEDEAFVTVIYTGSVS